MITIHWCNSIIIASTNPCIIQGNVAFVIIINGKNNGIGGGGCNEGIFCIQQGKG